MKHYSEVADGSSNSGHATYWQAVLVTLLNLLVPQFPCM